MPSVTRTRFPRGITQRPGGWRISVRVNGKLYQRSFKPSTPLEIVEQHHQELKRAWRAGRLKTGAPGTLDADVERYLTAYFGTRPGREERERHLRLWIEALGADTWRSMITREDVSRVLHNWKTAGLSADTCNKRRAALLAFYNALDGKGGQNPIRDVPRFRTAAPLPRGLSFTLIAKALKRLPKCRTRARLKLMAYTGARPIQVARLTPADWDDQRQTLILHATEKGAGTKPHCVPLSALAQEAMREFEDTDAWGRFASAPMGRMWKAAAVAVGLPADVRVYDLRHSFGTEIYRATGDLRITKELLGHSSFAMTERYTMAAIPERQTLAISAFNAAMKGRKSPVAVDTYTKRLKKR